MMKQPKTANGSFISLSPSTKESKKPTKEFSNSEQRYLFLIKINKQQSLTRKYVNKLVTGHKVPENSFFFFKYKGDLRRCKSFYANQNLVMILLVILIILLHKEYN